MNAALANIPKVETLPEALPGMSPGEHDASALVVPSAVLSLALLLRR